MFQPTGDLLGWNAANRWGLQDAPTGWQAVQSAGGGFIFVNNAALINLPALLRFQMPVLAPSIRLWTLRLRASLTHAFEPTPIIPYPGGGKVEWELVLSDGNRYRSTPDLVIAGFPGESTAIVYMDVAMVIDTATDFIGAGGTPNTMTLNFTTPAEPFDPGFLIDRLILMGG